MFDRAEVLRILQAGLPRREWLAQHLHRTILAVRLSIEPALLAFARVDVVYVVCDLRLDLGVVGTEPLLGLFVDGCLQLALEATLVGPVSA